MGGAASAPVKAGTWAWTRGSVARSRSSRSHHPEQPVRERAQRDRELLYIAVPMLAAELPFRVLDPRTLTVPPAEAASNEGTAQIARRYSHLPGSFTTRSQCERSRSATRWSS